MPDTSKTFDIASLRALFEPRAVAVIGASSEFSRIGGRPIHGSKLWGFGGGLYPVNPKRSEIQGLPSYPSVEAIGKPIDLALIAVPAAQSEAALTQCARSGVKAVIVLSAGFAELGGDDAKAQQRLVDIAREAGIRLMGPNCMGLVNARLGLVASFTSMIGESAANCGGISIVSQSGAFGSHCLSLLRQRGLGLDLWATTGNQADVEFSDCLAFMAQAPQTRVIIGCVEGVSDADKLIGALALAQRSRVPVVMMKLGRSEIGREAAVTHTAALTGSDAVFDAVLRQYGVHRAQDIDELFDVAYACTAGKFPQTPEVGLITTSGGFGIIMADAAEEHGLAVPALPEATQARLKQILPFASTRNPLDVTGQVVNDASAMRPMFEAMIEDGGYQASICYIGAAGLMPRLMENLAPSFEAVARKFPDHLLALSMVTDADTRQRYEELGYLVFENPTRAVAAIAALYRLAQGFAQHATGGSAKHSAVIAAPIVPGDVLDEVQSKKLLAAAGIPVLEEHVAHSSSEAADAAARLGFPVVMKILSPDIIHKSDIGGVALNIRDHVQAEAAYTRLMDRARAAAPAARLEGVLIAPMISDGTEMIVGMKNDKLFGPVILLGLGGIFVEILESTTLRLAPFGPDEARRMIAELKGAAILRGARGRPPADIEALAQVLATLSQFAAANAGWLDSIDINPMVVRPHGKGAVALDAVVAIG